MKFEIHSRRRCFGQKNQISSSLLFFSKMFFILLLNRILKRENWKMLSDKCWGIWVFNLNQKRLTLFFGKTEFFRFSVATVSKSIPNIYFSCCFSLSLRSSEPRDLHQQTDVLHPLRALQLRKGRERGRIDGATNRRETFKAAFSASCAQGRVKRGGGLFASRGLEKEAEWIMAVLEGKWIVSNLIIPGKPTVVWLFVLLTGTT